MQRLRKPETPQGSSCYRTSPDSNTFEKHGFKKNLYNDSSAFTYGNWLCLSLLLDSLLFSKCCFVCHFLSSMTLYGAALLHFYRFISDVNENKLAEAGKKESWCHSCAMDIKTTPEEYIKSITWFLC